MAGGVTVGALLGARGAAGGLDLDLLAGAAGLERRITLPYIQKTGLALAGFDEYLRAGPRPDLRRERDPLPRAHGRRRARPQTLRRLFARDFPCVMITMGLDGPPELAAEAERAGVPLLRTALPTPVAIARLTTLLEDQLAPRETRHGVLMDILGLGVLLTGESGIGKSECALDLVGRGHRLVADDTVEIRCRGEAILIGTCPELTRHHVEIRGLGLVNVTDLFGVSATRSSKRVELVVHLERWESGREYDRLGLDVGDDRDPRRARCRSWRCRWRPAATSRCWSRSRRAISCCARAAGTRRGCSPSGSSGGSSSWPIATSTTRRRRSCEADARALARHARPPAPRRFVVVTGLSGAGKSHALRALEDLGYFCVDNLPVALIPTFADLTLGRPAARSRRAAVVVDVREGGELARFPAVYRRLKRRYGQRVRLVFLEAADARDSAALQRDAAAASARRRAGRSPRASREERRLLQPMRRLADQVVDTSRADRARAAAAHPRIDRRRRTRRRRCVVNVVSFGFRRGVPADADLVFDVRFLPNPHFVTALRPLDAAGNARVARYVLRVAGGARGSCTLTTALLRFLLPQYIAEGKTYLTIAIGCTGGRHRSVAIAEALGAAAAARDAASSCASGTGTSPKA